MKSLTIFMALIAIAIANAPNGDYTGQITYNYNRN